MEKVKTFGMSFDGFFGFPIFAEVSSTLVVCSCPGYHLGAITRKKRLRNKTDCGTISFATKELERQKQNGNNNKAPLRLEGQTRLA